MDEYLRQWISEIIADLYQQYINVIDDSLETSVKLIIIFSKATCVFNSLCSGVYIKRKATTAFIVSILRRVHNCSRLPLSAYKLEWIDLLWKWFGNNNMYVFVWWFFFKDTLVLGDFFVFLNCAIYTPTQKIGK